MGTDRRSSKYQKSCHVGFIVEGRGVGSQPACIFFGGGRGGEHSTYIIISAFFQRLERLFPLHLSYFFAERPLR